MNILFLAVLLTIMQATPPVPRQAPDTDTSSRNDVKNDGNTEQQPPAMGPPVSIQEPVSSYQPKTNGGTIQPADKQKSVRISELPTVSVANGWRENLALGFTALLVMAGIVGVCAAVKTLKAIRVQAHEMKQQRRTMRQQLLQMQRQVSEMSAQTDVLERSVAVAQASADAANKGADAAEKSADALVNSERPWVVAFIQQRNEIPPIAPIAHCFIFTFKNLGRTPALIVSIRGGGAITEQPGNDCGLGQEVKYGDEDFRTELTHTKLLAPNEAWDAPVLPSSIQGGLLTKIKSEEVFYFIRGAVEYRDQSGDNARTFSTGYCFRYINSAWEAAGPQTYTYYK